MATKTVKAKALALPPEQYKWVVAEAKRNLRSPEMQLAWIVQCAMQGNSPAGAELRVSAPIKLATTDRPKRERKSLSGYPLLDAEPQGAGMLKHMHMGGASSVGGSDWNFSTDAPPQTQIFKTEREMAQLVVGNPSLSAINLKLSPLGEYGDYAYFRRTG